MAYVKVEGEWKFITLPGSAGDGSSGPPPDLTNHWPTIVYDGTSWPSRPEAQHVTWVGPENLDATDEPDFNRFDATDVESGFDMWQPIKDWVV